MNLLSAQNVGHYFGEREIFSGVNFVITEKAHVALIGVNGCGKTTLFKIIMGQYQPEEGEMVLSRLTRLGCMEQMTVSDGLTVYEETLEIFRPLIDMETELEQLNIRISAEKDEKALAALIERQHRLNERYADEGGLTYRSRAESALTGLGFTRDQFAQPAGTLSGGQRSKVQLCKLLLSGANLLLLDEPTNHLDIEATEWLENYLSGYNGAYIVISHDRYFLDRVTDTTMELENRRLTVFDGGYSRYMENKFENREIAQRHYENTMREIKRIEGIIDQQKRWNQERNYVTIASKQKQIDRLAATLVKVDNLPKEISFHFPVREGGGNEVLNVDRLALDYGTKHVFSELTFRIMKQERVFLIGSNGCGKSSLLKVLASKQPGKAGSFTLGSNIECGYFDQTLSGLHPEKQVIDEIWDRYPRMTETEVRSSLAIFLFRGDDVFKKVGNLSGGEKARLALLTLMLTKCNLLLLDEPTNHLDIASREALEQALMDYEGTLFIVSHDRYFINRLADRLYYMDEDGLTEYAGNYDYYEERRPEKVREVEVKQKSAQAISYKERRERESQARKRKGLIERTEKRIEQISEEISALDESLSTPEVASDYSRVLEISAQREQLQSEEDQLYAQLEELYAQEEE